jgi:MFS family permease
MPTQPDDDTGPARPGEESGNQTPSTGTVGLSTGRRWTIVVVSLVVTASAFIFINGVAFLIPALEEDHGTPLAEAGLLSSMPSFGMVTTLILWGYLLDRIGERIVLTVGSALTAAAAYAATTVHTMVSFAALLFVGGMAAASCNSAGGRLVSGWFPPEQRGLAMGVRQAAQPLGIALGALVIPELAERSRSATSGLIFPAALCALSAVASMVAVVDPPRKEWDEATKQELANPYRGSWVLRRIHAVSALLMVPQTVTVTFMLIWLITVYRWSIASAGAVVTLSQLLGAVGRVAVGRWSDRVGSRLRPVRIMAVTGVLVLAGLAWADHVRSSIAVPLMVAASVVAVLDNGLESTAITEYAGPFWSGRALGLQNTYQRLMAAGAPPVFGELIAAHGYPPAFLTCGLFPLLAVPIVPAKVLPPGLETRARTLSFRRLRRWIAFRSGEWPDGTPRPGPLARRQRLRRRGKAAAPPT